MFRAFLAHLQRQVYNFGSGSSLFGYGVSARELYGPRVDSASNRNEYQEYFVGNKGGRCVGLTTLPPSYVDFLNIWEPQPPETLRACPGT
jgi:hypothetical protein